MTDDIVTRLRDRYPNVVHPHILRDAELVGEAAVEIERLREQIDYRDDVISMLRAEVARLGAFLHPVGMVIDGQFSSTSQTKWKSDE